MLLLLNGRKSLSITRSGRRPPARGGDCGFLMLVAVVVTSLGDDSSGRGGAGSSRGDSCSLGIFLYFYVFYFILYYQTKMYQFPPK